MQIVCQYLRHFTLKTRNIENNQAQVKLSGYLFLCNPQNVGIWIHGFRVSVPVFKIHVCYQVRQKFRGNFSFLYKRYKVITVCWWKQPTSKGFQTCLYFIYLFKLYDKSFFILLRNSITKIWSKISKIRLILWKGWKKLESWVEMNVLCIGDPGY